MKQRKFTLALVGLAATFVLGACSSSSTEVVSMKGGGITQEDYYSKIKAESTSEQILANLVIQKVAEDSYGDKVSKDDINDMYDEQKKQVEDAGTDWDTALKSSGYTEKTFKDQIKSYLTVQAMYKANMDITEKDLKTVWSTYHPEVTAQVIMTTEKETADELLQKAKDGDNFQDLAKDNPATGEEDGEMKFDSTTTSLSSDVTTAAFALKDGDISDIIESTTTSSTTYTSTTTYYIVKMIKNQDKGDDMSKYKDQLTEICENNLLADSTFQTEVITKELKAANVKIKDDDLKDALATYLPTEESSTSSSSTATSSSKTKESSTTEKSESSSTEESSSETESSSSAE